MNANARRKPTWAELSTTDEPFDLADDLDFVAPAGDPGRPVAPPIDPAAFEASYAGELERGGDQPVPRISIQAFCERPDTAQLLQAASTDRRLAKAHMTVSMGGLDVALEVFRGQNSPNLVMVEHLGAPGDLIGKLDQLASECDPGTKVIVIGAANDITLYRELMRRGVSEYLVPPLQPLQLIRAISTLYTDPSAPFAGKTVAFMGAKGGVGASTIAHNTAWCIAEHLRVNCTLVDLDLSWGTTGLDFNQDPPQGVADALMSPERVDNVLLDRLLTRHSDHLTLFTAPGMIDRDYDVAADAYETVIDGVRAGVPYVVLDLPHMWTPWMKQTLMSADEVVICAQPDLASLRNAKNIVDLLKTGRPHDGPPKLVLNMVGVPKRPEIPVKDFSDALGAEPVLVLPFDPQLFGAAANNGQMIPEIAAESKSAEGLDFLAQIITGRAPPPKAKGLMSKFKGFSLTKKK
jgi:pilus assembly protein CpaE